MSTEKTIFGFLAGAAIGASLGILFAPDKGSKTRKKLKRKARDIKDSAVDLGEELQDKFEEVVDDFKEKFDSLKKDAEDLKEKLNEKTAAFNGTVKN
ncbi:MAG: YtxH domain-containing protein [Luteibaculaceae bacterium]